MHLIKQSKPSILGTGGFPVDVSDNYPVTCDEFPRRPLKPQLLLLCPSGEGFLIADCLHALLLAGIAHPGAK